MARIKTPSDVIEIEASIQFVNDEGGETHSASFYLEDGYLYLPWALNATKNRVRISLTELADILSLAEQTQEEAVKIEDFQRAVYDEILTWGKALGTSAHYKVNELLNRLDKIR